MLEKEWVISIKQPVKQNAIFWFDENATHSTNATKVIFRNYFDIFRFYDIHFKSVINSRLYKNPLLNLN